MNPYGNQYYQPFQAPQMQYQPMQMPQPSQHQQPSTAVLYAPTAKDFHSVGVQPGRQTLIIAQNEPYMAHKVADYMGQVKTTLYRIEQVDEADLSAPSTEYATKNELAQLQRVVQQIMDSLTSPAPKKEAKE